MRFGMMGMVTMLAAATAGMAHGERENGKPWSAPDYSDYSVQSPVVMLADAAQVRRPANEMRTLGVCSPIENIQNHEYFGKVVLAFPGAARNYLFNFEKQKVDERNTRVVLLQPPLNGVLEDQGQGFYTYRPNPGFHGQDKVVALVELGGYQVEVVYFIKVVNEGQGVVIDDEDSIKEFCGPKGRTWKISLPTKSPSLDNAALQALLDATGINNCKNKRGQTELTRVSKAPRHG